MRGRCVSGAVAAGCAMLLGLGGALAATPANGQAQTWYTFNGDLEAQKYSTATQITPQNVGKLKVAWQLHTGDMSDGSGKTPPTDWEATPLFVNNTLYVSTPFYRILAIDPGTGKIKWTFNPHAVLKELTQPGLKTRGVAYWQASDPQPGQPCQKIVYLGTMDAKLYAVDADTGKACTGFGKNGVLNVNQWNTVNNKWPLSLLQPPTVYKDTLFIGWAGKDWTYAEAPPGDVFAVDAQTGKLKWTFRVIPPAVAPTTGTANVWASMSVDPEHGILYLPISSPSPNFWGGNRTEKLPYATSITALNADTGQVIWSRQLVHHDVWDYDTNAAPTLVDIKKDGKIIPALVQTTKQGFLFVLNRLTGEPIYPITEHSVPTNGAPGDKLSPTQPYTSVPQPTVSDKWPGIASIANVVSGGYCSREYSKLRYDGRFTPPSLGAGSLEVPGTTGEAEWPGGALDPATNTFVVNTSHMAMIYRLIPRDQVAAEKKADPKDVFKQEGTPYGVYVAPFFNYLGMPCWKPPYGTISSYDLNTGKLLWKEPFGEVQHWGFYMPYNWGSGTIGGPVITKSGLIFIGASMDSRVRALDEKTGKVLWRAQVDAPVVSIPAVYTYKGKEYVVFTVGGNSILMPKVSDQLVAFTLPGSGG